jgi:hypothetical protein
VADAAGSHLKAVVAVQANRSREWCEADLFRGGMRNVEEGSLRLGVQLAYERDGFANRFPAGADESRSQRRFDTVNLWRDPQRMRGTLL